ncbi:proline--tRNA ligase [Caldibacillus lycopersici]|uniref:Proline--tRNA ligase n=1 Tax=Perspicuibacillus lycopersici TaxID=1325689 RepID=A0AAE3LL83_9BACI|nr:proline--tRNA ligase [Perspicuibacillus lycopersici]MCU9612070.1 proline--tRNA ligase [Perspicuibacillus lycopersici]
MKQSSTLIPTLREVPADAEIKSHQLLLRAGFIRQIASGVYSYLPLGNRVLKKVEAIVREEMDNIGAVELLMPTLQPAELWQETGRWYSYGAELMRMNDRHERRFALGPTHEEVITSLVRDEIKSYKRLPLALYQIQTKFRDEKRPRFGLLRGREFVMKDAYSFHTSQESLDEMYQKMVQAYTNIFSRLGLNFRAVIADSGAIGGKDTHEFMVLSEIGEDTIAYSDTSDYAANIEMAEVVTTYEKSNEALQELTKINTGNHKTIEEVATFLQVTREKLIKSLLFVVDEEYVLVLVRGDHEVNDIKVKNLLNATSVELASPEQTNEVMGCPVGNVGPIGAKVKIIADYGVQSIVNGICGANALEIHYTGVNPTRDFSVDQYGDIRFIQEGDPSPDGKGRILFAKGIEVGHVFKLGTRYSEAMNAVYLDENGRSQTMIMGCYGIGISRVLTAVAEQLADDKGLIWPSSITPYDVHVIVVNMKDEAQKNAGLNLYDKLKQERYDILLDDRQERAGVKFADSDLIGIPVRVVVGKRVSEGIVEVKIRKTGETIELPIEQLLSELPNVIK